nr:MAG TPA: hypothetical protein [Caudoviricetes sp.]
MYFHFFSSFQNKKSTLIGTLKIIISNLKKRIPLNVHITIIL